MPSYYFDTSGLVKRYIAEIGTAWVTGIMDPAAGNLLYVARLTGVALPAAVPLDRSAQVNLSNLHRWSR